VAHLLHFGLADRLEESRWLLDPIALASVQDLARRLRLAGDEYWDVRCVLHRGLDIGWSDFELTYGHTFGMSLFRTTKSGETGKMFFYSETDKPMMTAPSRRSLPWDRTEDQRRRERNILSRRETLFGDAFWLARALGLSRIPGLEGIDMSQLYSGAAVWIWLLFHASWAKPEQTILRANKVIPVHILTNSILRKSGNSAVLTAPHHEASATENKASRKPKTKSKTPMTEEERMEAWDGAAYEAEQKAIELLDSGAYLSELPMDPFTASAALLDLIASGTMPKTGAMPASAPPPITLQGQGQPVYVLGIEKPKLTKPQYKVVECLLNSGEKGLTKDELAVKSGHGGARSIMTRLASKDADWAKVLSFAGRTGGGYRIRNIQD
jgi:hypothetical protein